MKSVDVFRGVPAQLGLQQSRGYSTVGYCNIPDGRSQHGRRTERLLVRQVVPPYGVLVGYVDLIRTKVTWPLYRETAGDVG